MTTKMLAEIERMNKAGMNDAWISEELGMDKCTVGYWRKKLGLTVVGNIRSKRYTVYDGKTTQFIIEGTSRECAAKLGIEIQSFRRNKMRFNRGQYKKYEIYEVEA